MKRILMWTLGIALATYMSVSLIRYVASDIIGVWNELPAQSSRVGNYHEFLRLFHNQLPGMSYSEFTKYMATKLEYETSLVRVLRDLITKLDHKNQLHGGILKDEVNHTVGWHGDI